MRIPLSRGKYAIVDKQDYEDINQYKWHASIGHQTFYAVRTKINNGKKSSIFMHRYIINPPPELVADHINGNGLDNRRANLRPANHCQNNTNTRRKCRGSSKYRGVSWSKRDKIWRAYINTKNKTKYLGLYENEIDAAKAYNAAAQKYHGQFASLNCIP